MAEAHNIHRRVLNVMIAVLRYGGIWSYTDDLYIPVKIAYSIYQCFVNFCMWTHALTVTADMLLNFSDLLIVVNDCGALAGAALCVFKLSVFHLHRRQIISLIKRVYEPVDFLAKSSEPIVFILMKDYVLREKQMEYGFFFAAGILGSVFMLQNPIVNGSLPMRAQFPFDSTVEPMHSVALGAQVFGVAAALCTIATVDGITRSLCRYTSLQLEVLNFNFQRCLTVWPYSEFDNSGQVSSVKSDALLPHCFIQFHPDERDLENDSFLERFKLCLRHHQRLIGIVKDINSLIGSSLFMQIFTSTFMICLSGFQALSADNSADLVGFLIYLSTSFTHLAVWCWFGQLILYQSNKLTDSIWASGFEYEYSWDALYLVNVSLARAKQVLEIKAGNFWTLSMELFVVILKTAYSVFALLTACVQDD